MNLLIDVGGTTTRVSVSKEGGELLPPVLFPTEADMEATVARIAHSARDLLKGKSPKRVIAGVAGSISEEGVVMKSPNLPHWNGKDMRSVLMHEFGTSAHVVNDAILGGLGEYDRGEGKGARTLLYMTFGTGIGAARIVHGKPDFSVGSESGHQYLIVDDALVEAEDLVSGKALKQKYGKPGEELRDPRMWKECARIAAVVLYNTMLHFAPDKVVIGGSLVKDGSLSVEDIELRLAEIGKRLPYIPDVKRAVLGDIGGLYGASAYARQVS